MGRNGKREESEPLLPTHASTRPSQVDEGSTSPRRSSSSLSTSPTLSSASRGRLQGRRYLSSEERANVIESISAAGSSSSTTGPWPSGNGHAAQMSIAIASERQTSPDKDAGDNTDTLQPVNMNMNMNMSEKARGKQRARAVSHLGPVDEEGTYGVADNGPAHVGIANGNGLNKGKGKATRRGRHVTVIFANEGPEGGKVEVWAEEGESVGHVKDQIRHLHPPLLNRQLRLIHSGRLLTDGVLLLPWLRSLEERIRRQAKGLEGDVEEVLKEVGIDRDDQTVARSSDAAGSSGKANVDAGGDGDGLSMDKVFLHCTVGGILGEKKIKDDEAEDELNQESPAPRRRGFDTLLDAGLSPADVANMRRQFYESRGEEVPDGLERGDLDDEHARALEEQWIEGDMTADTATTTSEGQYSSILKGLLTGFLYPLLPIFFFREMPLPNFFEAEAEANGSADVQGAGQEGVGRGVGGVALVGTEVVVNSVFDSRVQMGVFLGLVINVIFGALRFIN